ncbi:hypothetical protein LTR86_010620 [Recurvomyces mirabilis]|nr:hypothetical protein LTR86_010620 [Recurvomyces mirabilis]
MYPQERERLDAITIPSGHDVELACFGLVDLTYSQYNGDPYEVAGPSQLPEYADPRLRRLDISHWTQVEVSDSWTAQALSLYLVTDHAVATLIDADLFIRDLVEKQTVFCSRLLVSSLMFWASQGMSQFDRKASVISYAFLQEARQILLEGQEDSLLTAAALQYLCIGCTGTADDGLAMQFLMEGKAMAESLRSAHAHELVPEHPPYLPIPGDEDDEEDDVSSFPLPPYMGMTFTMLCHFWRIVNTFTRSYYRSDSSISLKERASISAAESTYQKLMSWTDSIADYFAQGELSPHHVGIFLIFYHTTVIDIFRPFQDNKDLKLQSFAYSESTPQAVIEASLCQLKHLVLAFPLRYPAAAYSILWHPVCLYVANAVLNVSPTEAQSLRRDQKQAHRRLFLLCVHGYQTIAGAYKLAVVILKALLEVAIGAKIVTTPEARQILLRASHNGRHWSWTNEEQSSSLKVDLAQAMIDPKSADIASLVTEFDQRASL